MKVKTLFKKIKEQTDFVLKIETSYYKEEQIFGVINRRYHMDKINLYGHIKNNPDFILTFDPETPCGIGFAKVGKSVPTSNLEGYSQSSVYGDGITLFCMSKKNNKKNNKESIQIYIIKLIYKEDNEKIVNGILTLEEPFDSFGFALSEEFEGYNLEYILVKFDTNFLIDIKGYIELRVLYKSGINRVALLTTEIDDKLTYY